MRPIIALSIALVALTGCKEGFRGVPGNGVAKTEKRSVGKFDQVELDGIGRIEIQIGEPGPLTISGDENILPLIDTEVANGKLSIHNHEQLRPKLDIVITVPTPDVRELTTAGATSVVLSGVKNDHLVVNLNGVGSAKLKGTTQKFELSVAGAGSADAESLEAEEVSAILSGVGSATVHARKHLKATVAGVGSIQYVGNPTVEKTVGGIGTVKKKR